MLSIRSNDQFLPEKKYAYHVLFREMLGIDFQVIVDPSQTSHLIQLPNGAVLYIEDHFGCTNPNPAEILHPSHPNQSFISLFGKPHLSLENQQITCGSDLFAAAFFMLSRAEESPADTLDKHGRFPAQKSLAFKAGFLHRPVTNEWADLLWEMLVRLGWNQARKKRQFQLSISCDVDHPRLWWKPSDRLRTLGGAILKRRSLKEAMYFARHYLPRKNDPYDVFDAWMDMFERNGHVAQFNFMGKRPISSDCWYPLEHPFLRNLMKKIAERGHRIGFHPSYEAFEDPEAFARELASLQAVSPLEITSGRQHYLRFKAPQTWKVWEDAALLSNSSLGYPEAEGFRCGICHDFPVFDSIERKMLNLREQPLVAMDVTLAQYRAYSPEQASERLMQLRREVEKHGGDFSLLWHNSSWNTPFWEDWKAVFIEQITHV